MAVMKKSKAKSNYSVKQLLKDLSKLPKMTEQDLDNCESRIAKRAGLKVENEPKASNDLSKPKHKKSFTFHKLQNLHHNVDYKRRVYDVESLL